MDEAIPIVRVADVATSFACTNGLDKSPMCPGKGSRVTGRFAIGGSTPVGGELEAALAELVAGLGDVVVVIDPDGAVAWANRAATDLVGDDLARWVGRSSLDLLHPDDLGLAAASLETIQDKRVGTPIEVRIRTRAGWRLMELLGTNLASGQVALVLRDLTERRRWEVAGDDVDRFRAVFHHSAVLTMLLDADGVVDCATAALTRLLGHDPEVVSGRPLQELIAPEDRPAFSTAIATAIAHSDAGGVAAIVEFNLATRDGMYVAIEASVVSLLNDPVVHGLVVSCHDITRLRAAQQALSELAHHDSLTGLFNRRSFDLALEREWVLTQRDGIDSFVVVVDLDGFKQVNDEHGHAAGDTVLRAVGTALQEVARDTDVCGRIGGDEFGVLLIRCGGEAAALGFRARLEDELTRLSASIGTVRASCGYQSLRSATSAADALHAADLAMLHRKSTRPVTRTSLRKAPRSANPAP